MKNYPDVVLGPGGPIAGATVTVYLTGTLTLASLYSDSNGTTPISNPVTADAEGRYAFCVADGRYDLKASGTNFATYTQSNVLIVEDASFQNSVADLKAVTWMDVGTVLQTRGYYTPGDGGAGTYWWNSTDTTADNGGTVIAPNAGGTGRWNLLYTFLNVKQFGAKGDGVTDDTAALQAAFNTALSGTLCFPSGVYVVSTTISATGAYGMSLVGLAGPYEATGTPSQSSQLLWSGAVAGPIVWFKDNATFVRIRGLTFNGNQEGLRFRASLSGGLFKHIDVEDTVFLNQTVFGLGLGYASGNSTLDSDIEQCKIKNCHFMGGPIGVFGNVLADAYMVELEQCINRCDQFLVLERGFNDVFIKNIDLTPSSTTTTNYFVSLSNGGGFVEVDGLYCDTGTNNLRILQISSWSSATLQSHRVANIHVNSNYASGATPVLDISGYALLENVKVSDDTGPVARYINLSNGGVSIGGDQINDVYTGGTNIVRINRAGAIFQGGTQLNNYQQGTWTATLATGASTTPTATGYYTRIGNIVNVRLTANFGTITMDGVTGITITGLPFTVNATEGARVFPASGLQRVNFNSSDILMWNASGTTLTLQQAASNVNSVSAVPGQNTTAAPTLDEISITYSI